MTRKHVPLTHEFPYHIVARCNNCDWYGVPLPEVWQIYKECLRHTYEKYDLRPFIFVLMSNHFHMLAHTPQANLSRAMWHFMRTSSVEIGSACGRINRIYGGRYKGCLITNPNYLATAYLYVAQNPVRAGICNSVFKYTWSSLVDESILPTTESPFYNLYSQKSLEPELQNRLDPETLRTMSIGLKKLVFKAPRANDGGMNRNFITQRTAKSHLVG